MGVAYVIEGSALGGAVLARLALRELSIGPFDGAAFFSPEPGLAARWRAITAVIDAVGAREGSAGIVHSAQTTLRLFDRWLAR